MCVYVLCVCACICILIICVLLINELSCAMCVFVTEKHICKNACVRWGGFCNEYAK